MSRYISNIYDYAKDSYLAIRNHKNDIIGYIIVPDGDTVENITANFDSLNFSNQETACPGKGFFCKDPLRCNEPGTLPEANNGKHRCFYSVQLIQSDVDLANLLNLKNAGRINPKLADELAANYCISTVSGPCGLDSNGINITKCTRLRKEQTIRDSSAGQCIEWADGVKDKRSDYDTFFNRKHREWCNIHSNRYTPLCDCFNKSERSASFPSKARNFFYNMTKRYDELTTNIPPACWYEPCQPNSYSIPIIDPDTKCPVNSNICNQFMTASDDAARTYINNNSQTLNCAAGSDISSAKNLLEIPNSITTPTSISKYLPFIIAIIIIVLIVIKSMMKSVVSSVLINKVEPVTENK
jgi:hypothetical protein